MNQDHRYFSECFDCDFQTGRLVWRERPLSHFKTEGGRRTFNSQFVGKVAGGKNNKGYINVRVGYRFYKLHRVVWLLAHHEWPSGEIDHINRIRDDNRLQNLRVVSSSENSRNRSLSNSNSTGENGIEFDKSRNKWAARITSNGVRLNLGRFVRIEDAIAARRDAESKYGYINPNSNEASLSAPMGLPLW